MKRFNQIVSRILPIILSGTVFSMNVPFDIIGASAADEEQPHVITVVEGEPSKYGERSVTYLDENNNEVEFDLIPERQDRAVNFPQSFDLRDYGYVTPVKNQGTTGTCWAHAALAASESSMLMNGIGGENIDLSESHLVWFSLGKSSDNWDDPLYFDGSNYGTYAYDKGGNTRDAQTVLARWSGVQLEENAESVTARPEIDESQRYVSYGYLTNCDVIDPLDFDSIKQHIMNTGALKVSYYDDTDSHSNTYNSYYQSVQTSTNHAVTIVGWDDNFKKEYFESEQPEYDGAWICKNSWGTNWGDEGYFYLSYWDASISDIASFEISDTSYANNIYQYDGSYSASLYYQGSITAANVFTAECNETITDVAVYTMEADMPYIISIYSDVEEGNPVKGKLLTTQKGSVPYQGYHVINLDKSVTVTEGTNFSVVVTYDKAQAAMPYDGCYNLSKCSYFTSGVGKVNSTWNELTSSKYQSNFSIKVLTKSNIIINSSNFPDDEFRNYVKSFDIDGDGAISAEEFSDIQVLNLSNCNIADFTGIEYFTELTELDCSENPIVNLDLSHNVNLTTFICDQCTINVGDISCSGLTIDGLDMGKVSEVSGASVSGGEFLPSETKITYVYDCGSGYTGIITLSADSLSHTYADWENSSDTSHVKVCTSCGAEVENPHEFGDWSDNGENHIHTCEICSGSVEEAHIFGSWSSDGELGHTHVCTICGSIESKEHKYDEVQKIDEYIHLMLCSECGYSVTAPHEFGSWEETEEGKHQRTCADCGYIETAPHEFGAWEETEEGMHQRTCADCGYIETAPHEFGAWEETEEGKHQRTCADCGYIETVPHELGAWEETEEGMHQRICADCGYIETAPHEFGAWEETEEGKHQRICADCGYIETAPHELGAWEETEDGVHQRICADCGYIETTPHEFGAWEETEDGMHQRTCADCGYIETAPHEFGAWEETEEGKHQRTCADCGYIETAPHEFGAWEETEDGMHQRICADCGYIETAPHEFGAWEETEEGMHQRTCADCGYIETAPHEFGEWSVNINKTQTRICSVCGYSEIEKVIYSAGDINGDGFIDSFDMIFARRGLIEGFSNNSMLCSADINNDDEFNIADLVMLQQFLLGKNID